jgi:histidinol-phosphate aminotransferase
MNLESLAKPSVRTQPVYEPGKPIEYVARELGLDPATIIKLASNENPWGPSPLAVAAARRALESGELYPDGGCFDLRRKLAAKWSLGADQFVIGNGSNEIIELLGHVFLGAGDEVVMGAPAFVVYKLVTLLFGAKAVEVPLRNWCHDLPAMAAAITPRTKLVFVCTPNNPTGTTNSGAEVAAFVRGLPDHVIAVIDEAYAEFIEGAPDVRPLNRRGPQGRGPAHVFQDLRSGFPADWLRLRECGDVRAAEPRPPALQRERNRAGGRGGRARRSWLCGQDRRR